MYVVVIVVNPVGQMAVYEVTTTVVTVLGFTLGPVVVDEGTSVTDIVPEVNVGRSTPAVDEVLLVPVDQLPDSNKGVELVVTKVLLVFETVRDNPTDPVCSRLLLTPYNELLEELGLFGKIDVEDVVRRAELDGVGL